MSDTSINLTVISHPHAVMLSIGGIDATTDLLTNYMRVAGMVLELVGGDHEQTA